MAVYDLDQRIAATPIEGITVRYPLHTFCPYVWLKTVRPCICVGETSLNSVPKEH